MEDRVRQLYRSFSGAVVVGGLGVRVPSAVLAWERLELGEHRDVQRGPVGRSGEVWASCLMCRGSGPTTDRRGHRPGPYAVDSLASGSVGKHDQVQRIAGGVRARHGALRHLVIRPRSLGPLYQLVSIEIGPCVGQRGGPRGVGLRPQSEQQVRSVFGASERPAPARSPR